MSYKRLPTNQEQINERIHKNCDVIRSLMNELNEKMATYRFRNHSTKPYDRLSWADVGDLAHLRSCLNQALGYEDKDPS